MSDIILRIREVLRRVGESRTTLWRKVKKGDFPAPVELGPNAIGWRESEIDAYIANLPTRRYGTLAQEDGVPNESERNDSALAVGAEGLS